MPIRFAVLLLLAISGLAVAQTNTSANAKPDPNEPPPVQTTVTVTGRLSSEVPASMIVLGQRQLSQTPGVNLDDRLRQVPGFSLFRRSSSLVANPTTQGVSLRGIGSTGASRTLILWDGVPLNDPFGGWIYWTRVDPTFVDRVEVVRGANTSVFGYQTLGGTLSLFSTPAQKQYFEGSYFGGNRGVNELTAGYSNIWDRIGFSVNTRGFTDTGYFITPSDVRGTADALARVRFAAGTARVDYLGDADRLNLRFDALAESRENGTNLQMNSTSLGTLSANYTHAFQHDEIAFIGYHTREQFHSTFSSVNAARTTENLTSRQSVEAQDLGGALYWKHHGSFWNTVAGSDVDDATGTSGDLSYSTGRLTTSGGTLLQHGVFGQGDLEWKRIRFYAGIRSQSTGLGTNFISPNGGLAVGLGSFRLRASAYRSQRTPTLNELYRDFRVGNALTTANPNLVSERLWGVETGFDWIKRNDRLSFTVFRSELGDLIANRTLSTSPTLILRQRQNIGDGVTKGIETAYQHRWHQWTGDLSYLYVDARLSTGPRFAQVPKQQGSASITYSGEDTLISFGLRAYGLQFDDDINQYILPGFATLQLAGQRRLMNNLYAIGAIENLLDRQYLVALTPTPNIGAPFQWRLGLRWNGPLRRGTGH